MHWPSTGEADWDAVYADHLPRIYNYFRFRLAADADVEDLTARVFEKAWSARARYRRDLAGFSTWLYRIAQNVGVDYLRSRRAHAPLEAAVEVAAERTPEVTRNVAPIWLASRRSLHRCRIANASSSR